jgi:molybdate transport system substrate-binding protein
LRAWLTEGALYGSAPDPPLHSESFDVAILTPPLLDDLIAKGHIARASRAEVARVGLGLMIRAGAPKPDVSSVAAFTKTIQNDVVERLGSAGSLEL